MSELARVLVPEQADLQGLDGLKVAYCFGFYSSLCCGIVYYMIGVGISSGTRLQTCHARVRCAASIHQRPTCRIRPCVVILNDPNMVIGRNQRFSLKHTYREATLCTFLFNFAHVLISFLVKKKKRDQNMSQCIRKKGKRKRKKEKGKKGKRKGKRKKEKKKSLNVHKSESWGSRIKIDTPSC